MSFGSEFSIGIEEELLLVDPRTRALTPVAAEVLAALDHPPELAAHEAYAAEIELRSHPQAGVGEAVGELRAGREAARTAGATLIGAGVHPAAKLGDAQLVDADRYRRVEREMRGLIRRTPECALHVHVGMPDEETAVRAFNGMRRHLPLLEGLAANSPWWFGVDSGLASARAALVRPYPGRGIPPAFASYADYQQAIAGALAAGALDDYTLLWWDVRIHPRFGTLEVREMDAQSSLDDVAALAALVQGLARHEAERDAPSPPAKVLAWSSFRAGRDGLDATVLDGDALVSLRDLARRALDSVRPHTREAGSDGALEGIERIVSEGGGAGRRRAAHARGVIDGMIVVLV